MLGGCMAVPIAVGLAVPAFAQTASPAPRTDKSNASSVGEVVVTAERRDSIVRKVGFSIVAFSGQAINQAHITKPDELINQVPGITLTTADKAITISAIRGVSSTFRTASIDAPIGFLSMTSTILPTWT
jgi:iron complex outermembrane receptor protein